MKRIYHIIIGLVALMTATVVHADNLTAETVNFGREDTALLTLGLENDEDKAWTVYQFVLTLPEGLELATDSLGEYVCELSDRNDINSSLTIHAQTATRYAIVCYSPEGLSLTGTSGTLMTLSIQANDSLRGHQLTAEISEVLFSTKGGVETTLDDITVDINVAARIVLTATSYTVEYGEPLPTYSFTTTGAELNGTPNLHCEAVQGSPVGIYPIVIERGSVTNYNDSYINGTLTITRAPLTIIADSYSREYGEVNPTLTATYTGFKLEETPEVLNAQPVLSTACTPQTTVGEYPIIASDAEATNYDITYIDGTLTITRAPLTITADNQTRRYGDEEPSFTVTYIGFKNGETAEALDKQPTVMTATTATSSVGSYILTVAGAESPDYAFTYLEGMLTITKTPLIIIANDQTRRQGEMNPELTLTYEGFKNGETADILLRQPTVLTQRVSSSEPGTYPITVNGAEAENYEITHVNGSFTVVEAISVTLTATSYFREYGDENPVLEFTYEGAQVDGLPKITCEATATSPIGIYPIVIEKGGVANYNDHYVNGTLTITKAPLVISGGSYQVKQGESMPELVPVYTGFKNGETAEVLTKQPILTCEATSTNKQGTYTITVAGAEAMNYEISYEVGQLIVTAAETIECNIQVTGSGSVRIGGETVSVEGSVAIVKDLGYTVELLPGEGQRVGRLIVGGENVTAKVTDDNTYQLPPQTTAVSIEVIFVEDLPVIMVDGLCFGEIHNEIDKLKLMPLDEGYTGDIVIPTSIEYVGRTLTVVGIDKTAFLDCEWLRSVHLPSSLESSYTGSNLFSTCPRLAAIIWDASFGMTRQRVGVLSNPNLLVYVEDNSLAPTFVENVIVKGQAKEIILYGEGDYDFYCPRAFQAKKIVYEHYFSMETHKDECRGWEAIVLPFNVDRIHHRNGELTPFAVYDYDKGLNDRPFWLYEYGEDDQFKAVSVFKANTPYIISMPNDPAYIEDYRLGGSVSFSGTEVEVKASDEKNLIVSRGQKRSFHPVYQQLQRGEISNSLALNTEPWRDYPVGSVFVRNLRALHPFEAYFINESNAVREDEWFSVFDATTEIASIEMPKKKNENGTCMMYDMAGRKMNKAMKPGLYIMGGRKVVIR
ncbi:MAG: hypothetical protein J6W75_02300 [Bacteroidaceae bacterium]|nr:hypothetical protein [Bacteroidaceae bacterium]